MAKATKQNETDDDGARGVPVHGQFADYDQQRLDDEAKDRKRLRQEFVELTPEEASALQTELVNLKAEHEAEVQKLRSEYRAKKEEIGSKLAAGGGYRRGESAPTLLSNETDEEGRRRYTAGPL